MQISEDTLSVVEAIHSSIEGGFRKRSDIEVTFELAAAENAAETINRLVTAGKAITKLYALLKRGGSGAAEYSTVEHEFAQQINLMRELLAGLTTAMPNETLQRFDQLYFGTGQGVMRNLVDLAWDFGKIKDFQQR
jgi:hypothetical protein